MNHYVIATMLTFFTTFFLAFLIYFKNRENKVNQIYSAYSLSWSLWSVSYLQMITAPNRDIGLFWSRALHVGAFLIPVLFLHFSCALVDKLRENRKLLIAYYSMCAVLLALCSTPLYVVDAAPLFYFKYFIIPGPLYHLFTLYFFSCVICALYCLYKGFKQAHDVRRNQIKYVFFAYLLLYSSGAITAFFPLFKINTPWWGLYPLSACMIVFAYAIIKYHLMDIRIAISRAVVFILVYIPLLTIPYLITYWRRDLFWDFLGEQYWLVPTSLEGFFAVLGLFVYRQVQIKTEKRILKNECENVCGITAVAHSLMQKTDIPSLSESVVSCCKEIFGLEKAFFYVRNTNKNIYVLIGNATIDADKRSYAVVNEADAFIEMLRNKRACVTREEIDPHHRSPSLLSETETCFAFPCFFNDTLWGFLLLEEKSHSQIYAPMELDALRLLADKAAQALAHIEAVAQARLAQEKIDAEERLQSEKKLMDQHETYQKKLVDGSRKLLTMKTLKDLAPYTMEMLHEHIDPVYAGIYIYDWDKGEYIRMAFLGNSPEENPRPIKKEEVLIKYLFDRKEPVRYEDIRRWAEESASSELTMVEEQMRQLNAHLIVSMITDLFVGFLVLGKRRSGAAYTATDGNTFILVANNTAMAIHSIHMFKDSITDAMTSLWNRKQYADLLKKMVEQAVRLGLPLCLLMFDIDLFKLYNDTYGQEAGDLILGSVGEYLRTINRSSDMLFRWGGEEFAIIAINTDRESAIKLAERIREGMRHEPILSAITFSIGISCVQTDPAADPKLSYDIDKTTELLQKQADNALYEAKHAGRDRVCADKAFRPVLQETDKKKRPLQVLIVEDEEKWCKNVSQHLRLKKFLVRIAMTCKEAETMFCEEIPDVVLLDLWLPDGDGTDLYKKVFANHPEVPVAAMSGFGDRKAEVLAVGMKMFWLKPLDFPELTEWLKKVERERF